MSADPSKRFRKEIKADSVVIGPPRLTVYEVARIVGARATQIAYGAPILLPPQILKRIKRDVIAIAREELRLGLLPITVQRWLPDGRYQNIPISWLKYEENI